MLILTRRIQESIHVGEDVEITVLGIKGNQVRIGISAPDAIPVHRHEVFLKIQREKQRNNIDNSIRGADYFDDQIGNK